MKDLSSVPNPVAAPTPQVPVDTAKVIEFLKAKWKNHRCPMCHSDEWAVNDRVFELREYQGGNFILGGGATIYPVIPITCKTCSNTLFVNAIFVGVVSPNMGPSNE